MQTARVPPGGVWYTTVAPGGRRLFRGRHYVELRVDGDAVTVTSRRGAVLLDTSCDRLALERVRSGVLLQVLAHDDARTHVFEFRPRRHAAGHAFADVLR
jgi:hypothetical protein